MKKMQHKVLLGVPDRDGLWGLQVNCDAILTLTSATNSAHADGGHRITPQSDNPPHTTRVGVSVVTHAHALFPISHPTRCRTPSMIGQRARSCPKTAGAAKKTVPKAAAKAANPRPKMHMQPYSTRWQLTVNVNNKLSYSRNSSALCTAVYCLNMGLVIEHFGIQIHLSTYAMCAITSYRACARDKALHAARRRVVELGMQDYITLLRLFDDMVSPAMSYITPKSAPPHDD